ncbi:MAG: MBL fold metallo-hydrolase [Candidatus Hydrogenedentes bacterium]|nr:MBL fold metallo-hydrolase [Candidatus Hydrogenedentota bacterium]
MIFGQGLLGVNEANAFILGCEETKEAWLIDAGEYDPRFGRFLEKYGLRLTGILITHGHWDHTDGLAECVNAFHAEVYSNRDSMAGVASTRLGHGDSVRIGRIEGRIVETPGHTPDGISLIVPGMVFTGDALFNGSVGGTDGQAEFDRQIAAIREHIFTLPEDTQVHVGHGPSTTVGIEKQFNPFFV